MLPVPCHKSDGTLLQSLSGTLPSGVLNYAVPELAVVGTVTVGSGTVLRVTAGMSRSTLRLACIVVEQGGALEVGGDDCSGVLVLDVDGVCPQEASGGVVVRAGGSLVMAGRVPQRTWTTLTHPVQAGSGELRVADDVSDWPAGAEVAIASSDFDPKFAEVAVATWDAAGSLLRTAGGLQYYHHGADEVGSQGVDVEHAEVGLLGRHVVVRGGFVKAVEASRVQVRGVLFDGYTGGELESAPVTLVRVNGAVVVGNALKQSAHRCVLMEAVTGSTVADNVAYRPHGNCFHMNGGASTGNTLRANLVVSVQFDATSSHLMDQRGVTGFLMTNMDNTWVGNVVAGSDYAAFVPNLGTCYGANTHLVPIREFRNNRMHSAPRGYLAELREAVRYEGACSNAQMREIKLHGVYVWKISQEGGSKRGNVVIKGGVFADNARGWENLQAGTFPARDHEHLTYGQFEGVVFVGRTGNRGNTGEASSVQVCREVVVGRIGVSEVRCISRMSDVPNFQRSAAFILYDGPTMFHSCAFVNFDGDKFCFAAPRFAANAFQTTVRHELTNADVLDYTYDGPSAGVLTRANRDETSLLCRNRVGYEWDDRFTVSLQTGPKRWVLPAEGVYATGQCTRPAAGCCQSSQHGPTDGGCLLDCREKMVDVRIRTDERQNNGLRVCRSASPDECVVLPQGLSGQQVLFQLPLASGGSYVVHMQGQGAQVMMASADAGDGLEITFEGQSGCGTRVLLQQDGAAPSG